MIKSPLLPFSPNGNIPPKINPFSQHHYLNYKYYKDKAVKTLNSVTKKYKNPFEPEPSCAAETFMANTKVSLSKCKTVVVGKDS